MVSEPILRFAIGMSDFSDKRILVVDDVAANLDILVETLGDDYNVSVATDGISALEAIRKELPDLILLDILMPEMDGYEVCRRIKLDPETRDVPVIFVTSLTEAVDETRGFKLGSVDYITKPFNAAVIRARVKTQLELAGARKELERQNEILKENIELREQVEQVTRHDLKNPLQVLLASAQMFDSDMYLDKDDIRDMAQDQMNACYTMLNMINRSLDLYKLENGSYTLYAKETDILPLLDQILIGGDRFIKPLSLSVRVRINEHPRQPEDRFPIFCDELLFYSMMSNLVTNALEASPKGGYVDISLTRNAAITIAIENQGVVPPDIRERFFEKFVTSGKMQGTGLGTYSARLTAEIHGWRIELHTLDQKDITRVAITWKNR